MEFRGGLWKSPSSAQESPPPTEASFIQLYYIFYAVFIRASCGKFAKASPDDKTTASPRVPTYASSKITEPAVLSRADPMLPRVMDNQKHTVVIFTGELLMCGMIFVFETLKTRP